MLDATLVHPYATLVHPYATYVHPCVPPQISDGIMGTAQGVLRGCGRQRQLMVRMQLGLERAAHSPVSTCRGGPAGRGHCS